MKNDKKLSFQNTRLFRFYRWRTPDRRAWAERYPDVKKGWGAIVDRYLDRMVGPQLRLSLTILMWAVAAVLMIGCANLANLLGERLRLGVGNAPSK